MATVDVIDLQPRQCLIPESRADVIFYGGAKGGGKSYALLIEAAKGHTVRGYNAIIFRRVYRELKGLYAESLQIYPKLGGVPTPSKFLWTFASGATVQFVHIQHDKDADALSGQDNAFFGLDEAQRMTARMFWTLMSCLRTKCGLRPRMLLTLNPDPDSWVMEFARPFLDENGFPSPEENGVVKYFGRKDGKLRIYPTKEDANANGVDGATSYTFVSALLWHNPVFLRADPRYLNKLRTLPPLERSQYLDGCWLAKQRAGELIQSTWMPILHHGPLARRTAGQLPDSEIVRWCLAADLAATPVDGDLTTCPTPRYAESGKDPDYTAIVLLGQFRNATTIIWRVWRYRDVAGAIEWEIKRILNTECPKGTVVVLNQDPGQAGLHQRDSYAKTLRGIARLETSPPLNLIYSATWLARIAFSGMLMLRDPDVAPWQPALIRELEGYSSDGHSTTRHDDQIAALASGCVWLATKTHPRVLGSLPTMDGYLSPENAIRTVPNFRASF